MRGNQIGIARRGIRCGRWRRIAALGVVFVASICPAPAYAQKKDAKEGPPYDVQGLESKTQILPWVFGFAFIAAAVLVGMKNPQRSQS